MVTSFINVRLLAIISIILALGVTAVVATQTAKPNLGKLLQVAGTVTVNGTPAISGATVFSDSTITTVGAVERRSQSG